MPKSVTISTFTYTFPLFSYRKQITHDTMAKEIKLEVNRIFKGDKYTIGKMYVNGVYQCDTLEDTVRELPEKCPYTSKYFSCKCKEKVYGETAIPAGTYKVVMSYSPRFKRTLPAILNVPHFLGILIHGGNHAGHTEGCILVGENKVVGRVINSQLNLKKLLEKLEGAETITITIK